MHIVHCAASYLPVLATRFVRLCGICAALFVAWHSAGNWASVVSLLIACANCRILLASA